MSTSEVSLELSLDQAKAIIQQHHNQAGPAELASAIEVVLATSRTTGHRDKVSDPSLFTSLLDLLFSSNVRPDRASLRLTTLRCIGNLLADNDKNREAFVQYTSAVDALKNGIVLGVAGGDEAMLEQATLALKVAYNLCRDYAPAQLACLKAGLDRAVLQYITLSMFISENDTLELALELLADLSQHLRDVPEGIDFDKDFASQLLRLPCGDDIDLDTFDDMTAAISPYLADARFQETIMASNLIQQAFDLLDHSVFLTATAPDTDQGKSFSALLLRCISDLSTLDAFPSSIPPELIPSLTSRAILTDADNSAHPSVSACILLANAAPLEANTTLILTTLDLPRLYSSLTLHAYSRSHHSAQGTADYLHASAGLLRMLAQHASARPSLLPDELKPAAVALWAHANPDVQSAGLRLYRALLPGDATALDTALAAGHIAQLEKTYAAGEDRTKLEAARVGVALLRDAPVRHGQTWAVEMLCFAARAEGVPLAQAEGYLGLVMLGPETVAGRLDAETLTALGKAVMPQEGELQRRARDNALVLCRELLGYQDTGEELRTELERLLGEANVTFAA